MKSIVSSLAAVAMSAVMVTSVAAPANAHASLCKTQMSMPVRVGDSGRYIAAAATTKMPFGEAEPPHQKRCGLTAQIQVWAPSAKGGGKWKDYGLADADFTSNLRRASATPTVALLFGTNLYRLKSEFWADGPAGTIERPPRYSAPVKFNRVFIFKRK